MSRFDDIESWVYGNIERSLNHTDILMKRGALSHVPAPVMKGAMLEIDQLTRLFSIMREAKRIVMKAEQAHVFLETAEPEKGQDFATYFRLPFASLFIAFDKPVVLKDYTMFDMPTNADEVVDTFTGVGRRFVAHNIEVLGALFWEVTGAELIDHFMKTERTPWEKYAFGDLPNYVDSIDDLINVERRIMTALIMKDPLNVGDVMWHSQGLMVTKSNELTYSVPARTSAEDNAMLKRWIIHVVDFLNSPTIQLVMRTPDAKLQRARARSNKPALVGWYEIEWSKRAERYARGTPTGRHVSYRFDVRGHFKLFRRGRLAGRRVWCPPHQRGLAHDTYRPHSYRVTDDK